jgi:hypothetical protein
MNATMEGNSAAIYRNPQRRAQRDRYRVLQ